MTATNDWIDRVDRSHPNLKLIDKLKDELTHDGHEKDLRKMEQAHFRNDLASVRRIHGQVTEKEKMSKGDRSHPNLKYLDELAKKVTYDGWRKDFKQAEKEHIRCGGRSGCLKNATATITRKQTLHDGDRSDADVQFLDSLHPTYPGWEGDMQKAFDSYLRGCDAISIFHRFRLTERQRMYDGDRSHPRLVALDAIRDDLTYPGWKADVNEYEERHVCTSCQGFRKGLDESSAQIAMFKSKQDNYSSGTEDSSWMNSDQRAIVTTQWTFQGWEQEVEIVRGSTSKVPSVHFRKTLERFQLRQMLHDNDYTRHPLLHKLSSIAPSYPGWEKDMHDIKRQLTRRHCCVKLVGDKVQGMLNKQRAYNVHVGSNSENTRPAANGEEQEETGLKECVICMSGPRTHVFVPCGHMCACKTCSKKMIRSSNKCPICNQQATASIEVFFP